MARTLTLNGKESLFNLRLDPIESVLFPTDVTLLKQLVHGRVSEAERLGCRFVRLNIVGKDFTAKAEKYFHCTHANATSSDDAHRFAEQIDPDESIQREIV